jgi:hypothetical protein
MGHPWVENEQDSRRMRPSFWFNFKTTWTTCWNWFKFATDISIDPLGEVADEECSEGQAD